MRAIPVASCLLCLTFFFSSIAPAENLPFEDFHQTSQTHIYFNDLDGERDPRSLLVKYDQSTKLISVSQCAEYAKPNCQPLKKFTPMKVSLLNERLFKNSKLLEDDYAVNDTFALWSLFYGVFGPSVWKMIFLTDAQYARITPMQYYEQYGRSFLFLSATGALAYFKPLFRLGGSSGYVDWFLQICHKATIFPLFSYSASLLPPKVATGFQAALYKLRKPMARALLSNTYIQNDKHEEAVINYLRNGYEIQRATQGNDGWPTCKMSHMKYEEVAQFLKSASPKKS